MAAGSPRIGVADAIAEPVLAPERPASADRSRWTALAGLLACAAALGVAHGSEAWLGLVPCAFCLLEREPYEAGVVLAALALIVPARIARPILWLLTGIVLAGAALSFVHVGVEQHWWPDPLPSCSAPHFSGMTASQRLAAMPARPAKPCEDPDYLVPGVPVSMTQMGLAYALAVAGGLTLLMVRKGRYGRRATSTALSRARSG